MSVLKLNNLSRSFGGVKALTKVNMEVQQGEIIGLIGPNGAGKTTLFNMLTGIYKPTEGEIIYDLEGYKQVKNAKPSDIAASGVARTFQNIRLFTNMTVKENIKIGFHNNIKYNIFSSLFRTPAYHKQEALAEEKATELLKRFNLYDKRDDLSKNLSYGEQRRLEIARALALNPKILLLDEPAAGMNPNETKDLMDLIKWIQKEFSITIVLIEHDMSLVMNICSRLYVLDYGEIIANGTPNEIKQNPRVIKAYLGGEEEVC